MYKSHGNRPQGGWKGGNDRKFGGGGFRRDDRGFDRPEMHQATCASCGDSCEVPFKPNGSRPIYCRACFKKDDGAQPMKFDRKPGGFDRQEKRMYQAECDKCGNGCEVPFRPTGEKPVYCRECFGAAKSGATSYKDFKREAPAQDRSDERLKAIEAKLDMIIKALKLEAPKAAKPEASKMEAVPMTLEEAPKAGKAAKAPAKKKAASKKKK